MFLTHNCHWKKDPEYYDFINSIITKKPAKFFLIIILLPLIMAVDKPVKLYQVLFVDRTQASPCEGVF
jgi:hypothetical protein